MTAVTSVLHSGPAAAGLKDILGISLSKMNIGQMVTSRGHNSCSIFLPDTGFSEGILNDTPNKTEQENSKAPKKAQS